MKAAMIRLAFWLFAAALIGHVLGHALVHLGVTVP